MVVKKNLEKLLNSNFVNLTNQTYSIGKYDLPYIPCVVDIVPDYLALYLEVSNYNLTSNTVVCFYQYDNTFDGIHGIFNAIYYDDKRLLTKYRERFNNVKYIISPDYSELGDINRIENIYRLFKSRIVSLWFLLEMDIQVIPNITYANENYFDVILDGLENVNIVAFSLKGILNNQCELELLKTFKFFSY